MGSSGKLEPLRRIEKRPDAVRVSDGVGGSTLFNRAMRLLAAQPGTIFLGQNVAVDGSAMFRDFDGIDMSQRIELPVCEELQMGMTTGLAMQGFLPVCIFPRMDFMLRAMDQLVNSLDKMEQMSCGQWRPKVIIRTKVGSKTPLDAGPQHTQDHSAALACMLTSVKVCIASTAEQAFESYRAAIERPESTLVIERC
jgi:pyruvate/2-oxoglutarate/acetoin dehydrogenase E1 component